MLRGSFDDWRPTPLVQQESGDWTVTRMVRLHVCVHSMLTPAHLVSALSPSHRAATLMWSISTTRLHAVASRCSVQVPPNKQLYVFEVDGSIRVAEDEVFAPTVCGSQTAAQVLCSDPVRACFTIQHLIDPRTTAVPRSLPH